MLHAFYYVIFVKLADIISHSSTMMKVTALCRYSKIVSTLQIYKNKKRKENRSGRTMTRLNFTHKTVTISSYRPDAVLNSSKLKQKKKIPKKPQPQNLLK